MFLSESSKARLVRNQKRVIENMTRRICDSTCSAEAVATLQHDLAIERAALEAIVNTPVRPRRKAQ